MEIPRIVVTGLGAVTPIGLNIDELWSGLIAGKSGIRLISRFDTTNFPIKIAAEVAPGFDPTKYMDPKMVDRTMRAVQLAMPALKEALESSRLDMSKEKKERVGVVTSTMVESGYLSRGPEMLAKGGPRRADPLFITKSGPSTLAMQIGMITGANGPNTYVDSLCASGADALGAAMNFMRLGYADVMIVSGSDASLEPVTIAGMNIIGALSREPDPTKACRPFDLNRNGFVYGEASGVIILETLEHAQKRGATILAEFGGAGWSFDAYDMTAPYANTEVIAMRVAVENAGLKPEDIDYVNAHGTSTKLNDASETKAIKMLLGEEKAHKIPISSNKSMLGHSITAAGLIESIATVLTISRKVIPPTINYQTPDPVCDLDYVPNQARPAVVNNCLKNSFGLGGETAVSYLSVMQRGKFMESKELEGKVAIVTGASRGIGPAIALKLANLGAKVAIVDVLIDESPTSAVNEISANGGEAITLKASVTNSDDVKNMMQQVIDKWGKINILVNNAGITRDNLLLMMKDQDWDDVIDTNLKGTFLCTKAALRSMLRQDYGRIISMASIAGIMGNVGQANYSASKAGIIGFTKSVSREIGSRGITVNAIAPGFIDTSMTAKLPEKLKEKIINEMTSLKRLGKPEEIAELVAFLASPRAGYITGQVIGIDGGM